MLHLYKNNELFTIVAFLTNPRILSDIEGVPPEIMVILRNYLTGVTNLEKCGEWSWKW